MSLLGRDPTVAQKFMASLAREVMSLRTRLVYNKKIADHTVTADGISGNLADVYIQI